MITKKTQKSVYDYPWNVWFRRKLQEPTDHRKIIMNEETVDLSQFE
jgi:hypothetical protein